ncbi:hypothetical protein GCM10029978_031640 [Actinoallomurus acanthiterrae]
MKIETLGAANGPPSRRRDPAEDRNDPAHPRGDSDQDTAAVFTALFHEHHPEMVRVALLIVGDRASAEDVVQDANAFDAITRISATTGDLAGGFTRVPAFARGIRPFGSGDHLLLFGSGQVARLDDGRLHGITRGHDNVDAAW